MIGYCPIDFDEPFGPPQPPHIKQEVVVKQKAQPVVDETTECNYVVMFFIVGVIALAAMDSIKK